MVCTRKYLLLPHSNLLHTKYFQINYLLITSYLLYCKIKCNHCNEHHLILIWALLHTSINRYAFSFTWFDVHSPISELHHPVDLLPSWCVSPATTCSLQMASISSGLVTIPLCSLIREIFLNDTYTKGSSKPWYWAWSVWKNSSTERSFCKALIKHSAWVCANRITPDQSDMHSSRTCFSKALEKNLSNSNILVNHFTGLSWIHRFMYLLMPGLWLHFWHSLFNTW